MKLCFLIAISIISISSVFQNASASDSFHEKSTKFKLGALPVNLKLKEIKSNYKSSIDSLTNRFGAPLQSQELADLLSNCSSAREQFDSSNTSVFPYCRFETENLVLLVLLSRIETENRRDEYSLLVFDRSGACKSILKIGLYSKDDIGASSVETAIDTSLIVEKSSKEYVYIERSESCVKRQHEYYQIVPDSGDLSSKVKKRKKK